MKKLVIFDLDGTLLNTIKDLGVATNYALEKNGYPTHALEKYPFFVGNGVSNLIKRALPEGHKDDETIARLRVDFKAYYDAHNTDFTSIYDGIVELIAELRERGLVLAVASNKYEEATTKLVTHYFKNNEFNMICGQLDNFPIKPDPSIVFKIISNVGDITKNEVLYIGDSGVDMETARRAGVESVGVSWGFRPIDELQSAGACHIVNSPDEILQYI